MFQLEDWRGGVFAWICVRGRVCGLLGLSRYWQLLAIEVQISEYLRVLPFAPPIISLCLSKLERMLE